MSTTRGSLASFRLTSLMRLMASMGRTGRLVATNGPWILDLWFEKGALLGAVCGDEHGLAALESCVYLFPAGQFVIYAETPTTQPALRISPTELAQHTRRFTIEHSELVFAIPSLDAVPHVCPAGEDVSSDRIVVDGALLELLRAVDGRLSVAELIGTRQPVARLRMLAEMISRRVLELEGSLVQARSAASPQTAASDADEIAPAEQHRAALSLRSAQ